ncbi:MAG: heat-inducible transcriptional repressor HrcA, partial [bacterium]|nr:heat-inducible transcriptional repressor HrcA [bacterium]
MLDERKRQVLFAIIEAYIQTAEPVGSRAIAGRYGLVVSPATIRNEMADLEFWGFLEQPHTSAGRIPSDRGYRLYVDSLSNLPELTPQEIVYIRHHLGNKLNGQEYLLENTAKLLSNLTNYTSIVLGPNTATATLKTMQIIRLNEESAVIMVVTSQGVVASQVVSSLGDINNLDLIRVCDWVNHHCCGLSLEQLKLVDFNALKSHLNGHLGNLIS